MGKAHIQLIQSTDKMTYPRSGFTIRIEPALKAAFVAAAKNQARTANRVLRDFVCDCVKKNGQTDLFKQP